MLFRSFSAVSAGKGVAASADAFSYMFDDRVKHLRLTPEPERVRLGVVTRKGKLNPAAEKFCECAKEVFAALRWVMAIAEWPVCLCSDGSQPVD